MQTATRLISAHDGPITATSANLTGLPAAVTAEGVARMFDTGIDLILDGGITPGGKGLNARWHQQGCSFLHP